MSLETFMNISLPAWFSVWYVIAGIFVLLFLLAAAAIVLSLFISVHVRIDSRSENKGPVSGIVSLWVTFFSKTVFSEEYPIPEKKQKKQHSVLEEPEFDQAEFVEKFIISGKRPCDEIPDEDAKSGEMAEEQTNPKEIQNVRKSEEIRNEQMKSEMGNIQKSEETQNEQIKSEMENVQKSEENSNEQTIPEENENKQEIEEFKDESKIEKESDDEENEDSEDKVEFGFFVDDYEVFLQDTISAVSSITPPVLRLTVSALKSVSFETVSVTAELGVDDPCTMAEIYGLSHAAKSSALAYFENLERNSESKKARKNAAILSGEIAENVIFVPHFEGKFMAFNVKMGLFMKPCSLYIPSLRFVTNRNVLRFVKDYILRYFVRFHF